jgi:hypothetical protein
VQKSTNLRFRARRAVMAADARRLKKPAIEGLSTRDALFAKFRCQRAVGESSVGVVYNRKVYGCTYAIWPPMEWSRESTRHYASTIVRRESRGACRHHRACVS